MLSPYKFINYEFISGKFRWAVVPSEDDDHHQPPISTRFVLFYAPNVMEFMFAVLNYGQHDAFQ